VWWGSSTPSPGQNPYQQVIGPRGKRVFVDPGSARRDYKEGFAAISREFKLLPINRFNYKKYMTYGWQLTTGSAEEKRQAAQISSFLDIYDNSFQD